MFLHHMCRWQIQFALSPSIAITNPYCFPGDKYLYPASIHTYSLAELVRGDDKGQGSAVARHPWPSITDCRFNALPFEQQRRAASCSICRPVLWYRTALGCLGEHVSGGSCMYFQRASCSSNLCQLLHRQPIERLL